MSEHDQSFEEIIADLKNQVGHLEQGDLPLEDALKAFEHGMALAKKGRDALTAAEKKVEQLIAEQDGQAATRPLDDELDID